MKYSKVAAVVAGSMMAVGVAAPAFADTTTAAPAMPPTSITGGVNQLTAADPLQHVTESANLDSTLQTLTGATDKLRGGNASSSLKGSSPLSALQTSGLLGGLPLGGLPLG